MGGLRVRRRGSMLPRVESTHNAVAPLSPPPSVAGVTAQRNAGAAGFPSPERQGKATRTYTGAAHDRRVAWGNQWGPMVAHAVKQSIAEGK